MRKIGYVQHAPKALRGSTVQTDIFEFSFWPSQKSSFNRLYHKTVVISSQSSNYLALGFPHKD